MRRAVIAIVVASVLAGCTIGTVSRSQFEAEVQARGGTVAPADEGGR